MKALIFIATRAFWYPFYKAYHYFPCLNGYVVDCTDLRSEISSLGETTDTDRVSVVSSYSNESHISLENDSFANSAPNSTVYSGDNNIASKSKVIEKIIPKESSFEEDDGMSISSELKQFHGQIFNKWVQYSNRLFDLEECEKVLRKSNLDSTNKSYAIEKSAKIAKRSMPVELKGSSTSLRKRKFDEISSDNIHKDFNNDESDKLSITSSNSTLYENDRGITDIESLDLKGHGFNDSVKYLNQVFEDEKKARYLRSLLPKSEQGSDGTFYSILEKEFQMPFGINSLLIEFSPILFDIFYVIVILLIFGLFYCMITRSYLFLIRFQIVILFVYRLILSILLK